MHTHTQTHNTCKTFLHKNLFFLKNKGTTYCLETNPDLYEGVRFGFIMVSNQTQNTWHITGFLFVFFCIYFFSFCTFFFCGLLLLNKETKKKMTCSHIHLHCILCVKNMKGIRCVSQILPTNYVGSFVSSEYPMLNKVWYASAYCVKMNMLSDGFGAILVDRGDRYVFIFIFLNSYFSFFLCEFFSVFSVCSCVCFLSLQTTLFCLLTYPQDCMDW